jgi:hypothetical protein
MSKKYTTTLALVGVVILLAFVGYFVYTNYYLPSRIKLPPPLRNVDFPSEQIQYPANWPDDLKFPEEFALVDSATGELPETTSTGWSVKLRFKGQPSDAVEKTSDFFEEKGWAIIQKSQLDSGGFSIILEQDQGSGIVIIDSDLDDPTTTLIIATIFP